MLEVRPLSLPDVLEIRPDKFGDHRGFFSEVWNEERLREAGIDLHFVQDNHSYSAARGVLRGLHFQLPPAAQDKLVRVSHGAIYDVAVDIRRNSPTFGKWVGHVVSAELWNQILVPKGFAHGFVTIEENTHVLYKTTFAYRPEQDRAIRFDDPQIGIDWPIRPHQVQLSERDKGAPYLADSETGF
jgi:dTDP-4-dehydrorhamnose 3,5-epimerase